MTSASSRRRWGTLAVLVAASALPARHAPAQARAAAPPPAQNVLVAAKDGVQLRITYYPGVDGPDTIPVVLLHDFNETRATLRPLAQALQRPPQPEEGPPASTVRPRAVIAVDLRGHGDSKTILAPDGSAAELNADRFQTDDYLNMVDFDMEAVRKFLVEQNDARQLNLNKLCVVGCGMGANVAVLWAAKDWSTPNLAARKQGQDVKALALISPRWNFRGLMLRDAFKFPPIQQELSIFLAYGAEDRPVVRDCENMRKILERFHPEPPADLVQQQKDYFVFAPPTNLQGSELVTKREFAMVPKLVGFVEARLGRVDIPYVPRKK